MDLLLPNKKINGDPAAIPLLTPDDVLRPGPEQIRQSAHVTRDISPDQAAGDRRLGKATGLDPGVVSRNRDRIKSRVEVDEIETRTVNYPGVAGYLAEPDNMAISRDDLDNLTGLESLISEYGIDPVKSAGKSVARFFPSLAVSAQNISGMFWGLLDTFARNIETVTGMERGGLFEKFRDYSLSSADQLRQFYLESDLLSLPPELQGRLWDNPQYLLDPEWLVFNTGEAANSLVPMLAAAYLTGGGTVAAGAVGGAMEAGDLYRDLIEGGRAGDENALSASLAFGVAVGWLNKLGVDAILGKVATRDLAIRIGKSLAGAGVEAITEWAEEPFQALFKTLAEGGTAEETIDAVVESLTNVDVMPGAFFMGGGTAFVHQSREYNRIQNAERDVAFFEALDESATESKTRQRLPEAYEKAVEAIRREAGGTVENVYIDAELFQQTLDARIEAFDESLLDDTGIRNQLSEALATGGDIVIPVAKYATHIAGTDLSLALRPDLRFRPDGMSAREAEQARQDWAETMKAQLDEVRSQEAARTQFEEDRQRVYDDVLRRRQETGRVEETARSDAMYWAAFASTWALRYGGTPWGVYEQMAPEIRAEQWAGRQDTGVADQRDVDRIGGPTQRLEVTESEGEEGVRRFEYRDEAGALIGNARMLDTTIGDIEVEENYRRQGYGTEILKDLIYRGGRSAYAGSEPGRALMGKAGMVEQAGRFVVPSGGAEDLNQPPAAFEPRKTRDGKYKGAPEWVKTPGHLGHLRRTLRQLVTEGAPARFWYEESADAVMQLVNSDVVEAEKLIQLLAIYSSNTAVYANTVMAVRAYNMWKNGISREKFHVATRDRDSKAIAVLYDNERWEGRKTSSFYKNLMQDVLASASPEEQAKLQLFPEDYDQITQPVTVDLWVMRAMGYQVAQSAGDKGTGRYSFAENEFNRLTYLLNQNLLPGDAPWTPHQVQAALWTAIKTRYDDPRVKLETITESVKKGYSSFTDPVAQTGWRTPTTADNRKKHQAIWRKYALKLKTEDVARAIVKVPYASFDDALGRMTETITWETVPSPDLGHDLLTVPAEVVTFFTQEARSLLLDENGQDQLAAQLGVPLNWTYFGTGGYAGAITPNAVTGLLPSKPQGDFSRDEVRTYARALQYIYKQNAVPWFRADPGIDFSRDYGVYKTGSETAIRRFATLEEARVFADSRPYDTEVRGSEYAQGVQVNFNTDITKETEDRFFEALRLKFGDDIGYTKIGSREIAIINFRDENGIPFGMTDDEFLDSISDLVFDNGVELSIVDFEEFGAEGEYGYEHDWQNDPDGQAILRQEGLEGQPDLQAWIRGRREAFEGLLTEYSGERLQQRVDEIQQAGQLYQRFQLEEPPADESGFVELTHWSSQADLTSIDPDYYGTAYAGAEMRRKEADPENWVNRSYYGIAAGQPGGYQKEAGLGPHRYRTRVPADRLYNFREDPEEFLAQVREARMQDPFINPYNLYEKLIREAGYTGFWSPAMGMTAAVFEPMDQLYQGMTGAPSPAAVWQSQMVDFLDQKLPGRGSPEQIRQMVDSWAKKGLIKKEELEWSGLREWLGEQDGKVSKQEILDYLAANNVQIEEVEKGGAEYEWEVQTIEGEEEDTWSIRRRLKDGGEWETVAENFDDPEEAADEMSMMAMDEEGDVYTKFSQYQLPGGENYRELLLTLPNTTEQARQNRINELTRKLYSDEGLSEAEYTERNQLLAGGMGMVPESPEYRSPHWDEPNVLAHVRFNERTDVDGNRVLFIEEIQSDWHQEGRKKGYDRKDYGLEINGEIVDTFGTESDAYAAWQERRSEGAVIRPPGVGVPDAPFKKSWPILVFKRMVRYAAENGFDKIAWTPGEVQADRYDLSKQVETIKYEDYEDRFEPERSYSYLRVWDKSENLVIDEKHWNSEWSDDRKQQRLEELLGKEISKKLWDEGKTELSGLDLKVGGEGMKGFYDKILSVAVNKFFNKKTWGNSRVATTGIETTQQAFPEEGDEAVSLPAIQDVWALPITPEMREKALTEGMPLFQGPRGSVTPFEMGGTPVIRLFESANPSTFLHESGHTFFIFMGHMAGRPDAPQELRDDWRTVLDYVGNDGTSPLTDDQHEKLAKTLEAYFLEGKAPSMRLRNVFQKFADWLKALYRQVTALGVEPTREIRDVLDRMFATDEEIAEVQQFYDARKPFFEESELIDEEARRRYERLRKDAHLSATDKRLRKYIRAYLQALGGKKELEKQASDEINTMPVYAAMDAAIAAGGFFIGDIEDLVGEKRRIELNKKRPGIATVKGNAVPDILAAENGFDSPAEMIDAMLKAESKAVLRKRMVGEELARIEQEIRNGVTADILMEKGTPLADDEYHSDSRLAVLAAEVQMLQQRQRLEAGRAKAGTRRLEIAAIRDVAGQVLADKPLNEALNYYNYSRAEAKAARQARQAKDAGDFRNAERFKRRELLNHALVLEAVKAREEHAAALRRFSRAMKRDIDDRYANQVVGLLNKFGLTKRVPQEGTREFAAFMEGLAAADAENPMGPTSVPQWSDWVYTDDRRPQPDETYKTALSLKAFRELNQIIVWLVETGYDIRKGRLAAYEKSLADLRDELITPALDLKDKKVRKKGTFLRRLSDDVREYIADHDMLPFILDMFDGFTNVGPKGYFGPNRRNIGNVLADRQSRRDTMMEEAVKALEAPVRVLIDSAGKHPRQIPTDVPVPELIRRDGDYWTFEKIVAIALNMGNDTNMQRLVDGYGLKLEELLELTSILTEKDWGAVQAIWDHVESYWPQLDAVHYKVNHFHQDKVKARPIAVRAAGDKTVQLKGGYYPLKYDAHLAKRAAEWDEKDDLMQDTVWGHPGVKSGILKARVNQKVYLPVNLSLSVLYNHLEDAIHYITHADVIKDIDRITQSRDFQEVIEDKFGTAVYRLIRPALKHIARPERVIGTLLDKKLDRMRALSTAYILGLNTSVAVKQLFSVPGIINDIGLGAYVKGIGRVLKNPVRAFDAMHEMSSYMKTRSRSFDRDLKDSVGKLRFAGMGLKPGMADQVRDWSFVLIRMMDFLAVYPSWWGAYKQGLVKKSDPEAAVRYADEMIRQSQPSSKPMDLSNIQRSRKGLTRVFTMFMTFTAKYGNRQRYYFRGWREGKIRTRDYGRHLLYEAVLPPLLMNLMFAAMWGDDPDPEDALIDVLLYQFAGYTLVREIAGLGGYLLKKYGLEKKDVFRPDITRAPAVEGFKILQRSAETMTKWLADMDDDEQFEKAVWAFAELASFWIGVPAPKLARNLLEGMRQFEGGEGTAFNMVVPNPSKRER